VEAIVVISNKINLNDYIFYQGKPLNVSLHDRNLIKDFILLYVYELIDFPQHGFKIGMTKCRVGQKYSEAIMNRIKTQTNEVALNEINYKKYGLHRSIVFWGINFRDDSVEFKDHQIHKDLLKKLPGIVEKDQEWFQNVPLEDIIEIFKDFRVNNYERIIYSPRKEQSEAIYGNAKSVGILDYFDRNLGSKYLLNCKMRFGKCYTTYKYAEIAKLDKILILTFVPAVEESWRNDLLHIERD
jgi:hypothetical protein